MNRNSFILACGIALAFTGPSTQAENLFEVYQAAVKSDPVIREADARRMAALEVKPQARGLLLPQVSVAGEYSTSESDSERISLEPFEENGQTVFRPVDAFGSTDTDDWNYRARVTQTIFRWDQWQALKRADSEVAVAEANYRAAEQDLLVRVASRYFDVLAADDTLAAAEATLQAVNRQLEQAEKRFEVGLIAITDVQEARAAHDTATASVIAAKRALASAHEFLRELSGEAYQTLVKPAESMPLDQPQPADEQAWVKQAVEQNLSVIAARLGVDVAKSNVKIAQSGHMPTIDLFAQRSEFDTSGTGTSGTQLSGTVRSPADSNTTDDTIGLQVTIPIFSGGVTSSRVREQVYLHRASREKLDGALRSAERQTRDAYLGVLAEKARVAALQQSVKSNQTALEATEAGFDVGTRTTVDVLDARRRLFEAQRDYARSRYDYLINIVRLKSAAGVLAPQDLSTINGFLTTPTTLPVIRPAG
jgi:outer membrane protein